MNKKYLDYLFKQRKAAYLFFGLLVCAISLSPFISGGEERIYSMQSTMTAACVFGIFFTFVLPAVLFAWVHRRRSADLYFALPVKRKDMLVTTVVFITLLSWIYFLIPVSIAVVLGRGGLLMWLAASLFTLFFFLVMTLFNSMLFLIANNIFDGVVMMGAYSMIPVVVYAVSATFLDICVAGMRSMDYPMTLMRWLSPTMLGANTYNTLWHSILAGTPDFHWWYCAALVLYGLLAAWVLKMEFVERQSERAEQVSDRFFSYPLIINFYAFCIMIVITAGKPTLESFRAHLIWYLILLLIYIVAMFIYRRKIQVRPKDLGLFLAGILLSLALSAAAWSTRGFGLADNYRLEEGDSLVYSYWATVDMYDLTVREQTEEFWDHYADVQVEVLLPVPLDEESRPVRDLVEGKRRESIDDFYQYNDTYYNGWLNVYNLHNELQTNNWQYSLKTLFTEEELELLAQYGTVTVYAPSINEEEGIPLDDFLAAREAYIHDHE